MLLSLLFVGAIIAFGIWLSRYVDKRMTWNAHHYLYRVKCEVHNLVLLESADYPDTGAIYCSLCGWREDDLSVERFDITRFSQWERIG